MSAQLLEVHDLTAGYGDLAAVRGLDLEVAPGEVVALFGPNGAGKTTSIRLLLGLLRPAEGSIHLFGQELDARRDALRQVGALVESPSLYGHLSGRENLEVTRRLLGAPRERIDWALERVDLAGPAHRRVREYSLGMRQRLAIALALLGSPRLLVLDEPANGLDPAGIAEFRQLLRGLAAEASRSSFPATCFRKSSSSPRTSACCTRAGCASRAGCSNCASACARACTSAASRRCAPPTCCPVPANRRACAPTAWNWSCASATPPRSTACWSSTASRSRNCTWTSPRWNRCSST
jgi:ABC-type Na+ transport system ATPase subunit NatA